MSIRKTPILNTEYYHIYNRGNSKKKIFLDDGDYLRFIKLLYLCNSEKNINFRIDIVEKKISAWDFERGNTLVSIGAWVLMPNHFHIYITGSRSLASGEAENAIVIFLQRLSTAYAKYFNAKYEHTGSLFEGKYKSVHMENDVQAKYLFSYIHLNPIKLIQPDWKERGIKNIQVAFDFINSYKWSSFHYFKGKKLSENAILNLVDFPNYFETLDSFDREILEWFTDLSPETLLLENYLPLDEQVDVVDESCNFIKVVSKKNAHIEGLLHKCVIAQVIDTKGRWLLVKQSKDRQDAGQYVSPVGGHISSGESEIDVLKREVFEELGLKDFKYKYMGRVIYNRQVIGRKENHFFIMYKVFSDEKPILNHEAESCKYFTLDELKKELKEHPKNFGDAFYVVVKEFHHHLL